MSEQAFTREEVWDLLPAYALGAVSAEERRQIGAVLADWPEGRAELAGWMGAADLLAHVPDQDVPLPLGLEGRIISQARADRRPADAGRRRGVQRFLPHTIAAGLAVIAAVFGMLAFQGGEPAGETVLFSADGRSGVYITDYLDRPFALTFWGLPRPSEGEVYQLWSVREGGELVPGAQFLPNQEGRASLPMGPHVSEGLVGFAVSRDDPDDRSDGRPARDAVVYQFTLD